MTTTTTILMKTMMMMTTVKRLNNEQRQYAQVTHKTRKQQLTDKTREKPDFGDLKDANRLFALLRPVDSLKGTAAASRVRGSSSVSRLH